LVVTRDGVPLGYEVFAGNRTDVTTVVDFGFNWDWNLASVPIETENSARSGENGLSLKCGFPPLHILVGDLLLPRSNRFHGELVQHAEDFRSYSELC